MKVFVVMGNDFPAGVFEDEQAAEEYIEHIKSEEPNPRIYWRVYPFDLVRALVGRTREPS